MAPNRFLSTSKGRVSAIVAGVALVLLVVVVVVMSGGNAGASGDTPLFEVMRGPLTISIEEAGTITARDQKILQNEVEGQTTILRLVAEGAAVKKGDLLVELDASQLEDRLVDQQIRVQNGEAARIRAEENLAGSKIQAQSDIARVTQDLEFAREDLLQYRKGEYPKQLKEARARITLAEEKYEQAKQTMEWSKKLLEDKYISQTEFEKDRLSMEGARLDHELAIADLDLLEEYTKKRREAELESAIEQADLAVKRVERQARADVVQAEADLKAKELELKQQRDKLEKIKDQITKTKLYSPVDGMVVYASSVQMGRRRNDEPLEEGQSVRERQELIYLPTTNSMTAEMKVHESDLEKVAEGQRVRISVEALPGRTYRGTVTRIAPLPDAQSRWFNPDLKVYTTLIELTGDTAGLRTGMTCRVEILVERFRDALYVPVQAIVRIGDQPTAYVLQDGELVPRAVEIGLDNNRMVHVLEGLEEGERVALAPPLEAAAAEKPEGDFDDEDEDEAVEDEGSTAEEGSGKETGGEAEEAAEEATPPAESGGDAELEKRLDDMIGRMDSNGNGRVELEELSERARGFMGQSDTNGDGVLDRGELRRMAERFRAGGGRRPGGGRPGGDRPGGGGGR